MTDLKAKFEKKIFDFKQPSGTSRGVLTKKHAWFITVWNDRDPSIRGIGECSIIPGLSPDFESFESYERKLNSVCNQLNQDLIDWPSIRFGVETAILDLENGGTRTYFDNAFAKGNRKIPINGLIWMGDKAFMHKQIEDKIAEGFTTIIMKIGAIDFNTEIELLQEIRRRYSKDEMSLRVDANGAFSVEEASEKLERLFDLEIHSIEQPIAPGQSYEMAKLCAQSELDIALDEELIGVNDPDKKNALLTAIKPQYIILKPSLHGGILGTREWIEIAEKKQIQWWITSALESNIGLKAICELTAEYKNKLPQGLGTGSLYLNNVPSPLHVQNGYIHIRNK